MTQDDKGKESIDEEIIRNLMDLRSYLEKRIQELDEEIEKFKTLFKIIDEVIVTKSFKKAETIPVTLPETPKIIEEIPLKTSVGMLLATMYVGNEDVRIVPAEGLIFTINTPPFQTFLTTRILEPMKLKDNEDSQKGIILPNQILTYETVTDGEVIKELIIRNYGTKKRLREIVSSVRWTFDKMYEKSKA